MADRTIRVRIVYLHQYYNTPEMSGGTRSYEMARRWAAAGHDVHVVTSDRDDPTRRGWRRTTCDGVTVHWYPVLYRNSMGFATRVAAFVKFAAVSSWRSRKLRGDVIYATSTPLSIFIPAYFAKALRPARLGFEVRDLWPEMLIAVGYLRNPVLRRLAQRFERTAYRKSDLIVALSDDMADGVIRGGGEPSRILVAPNSCDTERFAVDPSVGRRYREANPWLNSRPLIVYCGTLGRINDVSYLVKVAAHMKAIDPTVAFAVYGSGQDEGVIRELAIELGVLNENFFLMGRVPKDEMPAILSAATVATSLFAPVPEMQANSANKFFDALASGRPIAINYGGWQAEILRESGAGIVLDPSDPAAAADELLVLVNSEERLRTAGRNAAALAAGRFSRDRISADVLSAIEGICVG